jgi:hypothetical protein
MSTFAALAVGLALLAACAGDGGGDGIDVQRTGARQADTRQTDTRQTDVQQTDVQQTDTQQIDVRQWASDYNDGASTIRTAHVVTSETNYDSGEPVEILGEGDFDRTDQSNIKRRLALRVGDMAATVIVVDGKMYFQEEPGPWTEVESDGQDLGGILPGISASEIAAMKEVAYRGDEDVAGTLTHHYTVTYDAQKWSAYRSDVVDGDTVERDTWVDDDWRVVKYTESFSVVGKQTTMSATYSRFNEPVTIEAPAL